MEESLHRSILASGAIMCCVRSARCTAGPVCRCVYTQMCAHMVHRHMYMNVQVCVRVWVPSNADPEKHPMGSHFRWCNRAIGRRGRKVAHEGQATNELLQ